MDRCPHPSASFGIVVMGVSGSGKSTLGALLADRLGCAFLEGDLFHSDAAVAAMRGGRALSDDDRWPWLDRVGAALGAAVARDGAAVAACSALKRGYRDRLAGAAGPLRFVLLDNGRPVLRRRLEARPGHYIPASLLDSQLRTLERPATDERALALDGGLAPDRLCGAVLAWLSATSARVAGA